MNTTYKGIDYGLGGTNRDKSTGIRFGVISQHDLNPDAAEDIWQQGQDLDFEDYQGEVRSKLESALSDFFSGYSSKPDHKDSPLDRAVESAFEAISDQLGDHYEATGDCTRMIYEREGYKIQTDSGGDIWVLASKFFTYAQFCSPCAPGACYLTNPLDQPDPDNRAYCLGHDWFEDNKAPYPVYSVETGELVNPA